MEYTITDALVTSAIGISVVMMILAVIAVIIVILSKIIRAVESGFKGATSTAEIGGTASAPAAKPMPEGMNNGEVELVGTDEKTAAVIMAVVSQKTEIPLNRLSFKSIKLLDENKKGDGENV